MRLDELKRFIKKDETWSRMLACAVDKRSSIKNQHDLSKYKGFIEAFACALDIDGVEDALVCIVSDELFRVAS